MAGKTKPGSALKGINIKLKMINDLMDVTGSAKDSWNPAEISDDMKAIAYIHRLADTWNPAQLNEALKYLGFKTVDTWNAAELEETKNKLVKYFLPTEATGKPITFNTYGNLPYEVSKAEVTFLPKQSGSGEPSPDNVRPISGWTEVNLERTGKNLCETVLNYVLTMSGDSRVMLYNSAGTTAVAKCRAGVTYTVSGATGRNRGLVGYYDHIPTLNEVSVSDNTDVLTNITDNGYTFTATYTGYALLYLANSVLSNVNIQIELGSTATTYEPYNGETVTVSFGQTVYGGKVDFVSGKGLEEWDYIASYDGETLPGEWISDRDFYAPGTTPTTGAEVAYKLSEAVELTLTPQEIELLKGQNVIWTDGDDILIEYKALLNS